MLLQVGACITGIALFQFLVGGGVARLTGKSSSPRSAVASGATRNDLHVKRKLQHALTGLMIYAAVRNFGPWIATRILFGCTVALYLLQLLRKVSATVDSLYLFCFMGILRRDEITQRVLPGALYFLLGCALVTALYPTLIAQLAILHLSVGDPAASFFGTLYGRRNKKKGKLALSSKSWAGFIGCLCVSALASAIAFAYDASDVNAWLLLLQAFGAGVSAACAESINVGGWDDNLSLPLLTGGFMQLVVLTYSAFDALIATAS